MESEITPRLHSRYISEYCRHNFNNLLTKKLKKINDLTPNNIKETLQTPLLDYVNNYGDNDSVLSVLASRGVCYTS